jgi:uncharacterized protein
VLPASAPPHVGTFEFQAGTTVAHINPGVTVLLNGNPIQKTELHPDAANDRLVLGDISLWVHASGQRLAIRMKDKNSKLRKNFAGANWFPINESIMSWCITRLFRNRKNSIHKIFSATRSSWT